MEEDKKNENDKIEQDGKSQEEESHSEVENSVEGEHSSEGDSSADENQPLHEQSLQETEHRPENQESPKAPEHRPQTEVNRNLQGIQKRNTPARFGIGTGVIVAILLHIVVFFLIGVIYPTGLSMYLGFGLFQLVYILPVALVFRLKGYGKVAGGMWIIAGVTFLLNAACWGLVVVPFFVR